VSEVRENDDKSGKRKKSESSCQASEKPGTGSILVERRLQKHAPQFRAPRLEF